MGIIKYAQDAINFKLALFFWPSGEIPIFVGDLRRLTRLDLSCNTFNGFAFLNSWIFIAIVI